MLYGRRQGRALKQNKKILLENFLPLIQIRIEEGKLTSPEVLEGYQERWLEIGFGNGEHLGYLAEKYPHILMIGCEPFINGIGSFLEKIDKKKLSNVCIFTEEAQSLLQAAPKDCFSKAFLLFPDPWPKKRHHKRRFVSSENVSLLARCLKKGSDFLFATDHKEYREWALEVFKGLENFQIISEGFESPDEWVQTRFQEKGLKEGRPAYFVRLKRL
jgi:tRNA (guanine-N7-)-methyltransferase